MNLKRLKRNSTIDVMVGTGCQSRVIGVRHLTRLGLKKEDLKPATMGITAANNNCISVLGAVILLISGSLANGSTKETRQVVYVTPATDKFYLIRQACMELWNIPSTFTTIGEVGVTQEEDEAFGEALISSNPTSGISFTTDQPPRSAMRKMPPPKPTKHPFPGLEQNREKLAC